MKNKNRTQPTFSTKTDMRHPKNKHPKTDHNQGNKKRTKMKISKISKYPINPVPYWYNPKYQNALMCEKHPFLVRF